MVENRPWLNFFTHLILILGVIVVVFPVYVAFVASTQTAVEVEQAPMSLLPGAHFIENYMQILTEGGGTASRAPVGRMLFVSLMMAMGISIGKILISLVSAFAIVYFRFPGRKLCFWLIFITLMLPVIASATATFLFRQFFLTVPDELTEAARMDGAGPMRFFFTILMPLSLTNIAAMFVIQFIYGWNQYLWPLLVTTSEDMYPIVIGIKRMIGGGDSANEWNLIMATAMLAMIPPAIVVTVMQRWFVKGLVDTEK